LDAWRFSTLTSPALEAGRERNRTNRNMSEIKIIVESIRASHLWYKVGDYTLSVGWRSHHYCDNKKTRILGYSDLGYNATKLDIEEKEEHRESTNAEVYLMSNKYDVDTGRKVDSTKVDCWGWVTMEEILEMVLDLQAYQNYRNEILKEEVTDWKEDLEKMWARLNKIVHMKEEE
jgi:hypothetical protein